ncbi:hypothetical protein DPEC_G00025270 [Dallia pectoralis]|uniref:Uncharacterized protein n=1 Tax=Dallia pectoralis TaxID=75939 RepID=A0ACC2HIB0_DALPE|nr:hypothetical protein DPEC_G00025270 [Dallia pectoralis]
MRSLDHETLKAFRIEVQARDAGVPPQTSNATVHVFVVDLNDNPPVVVYPPFPQDTGLQISVPQSTGPGQLITKLVGVDPDSGHNAWLFYSIAPGPHASLFRVAPHTGELRTARKLAEEEDGSAFNITVVVQDNGEPPLSTSVAITINVEEKGAGDTAAADNRKALVIPRTGMSDVTLYLIISLASVSALSFLTFLILMVQCLRRRSAYGGSGCCYSRHRPTRPYHQRPSKDLHLQLNTDGPIRYMEVVGGAQDPPGMRTYRPCYSTISSRNDFVFVKTPLMSHNNTLSMTLNRKHLMDSANEQKPPNTDWRFNQGQRPGPSGAGGPPEMTMGTGPWPNPPTEAEQLQALMAAANEVSEATATLGPGTMGLSTRYSPQFTLQHVPDYRQNVYIPGSTATLTSNPQQQQQQQMMQQQMAAQQQALQAAPEASSQPEAPKAAQTPASKKKSTKKEKK